MSFVRLEGRKYEGLVFICVNFSARDKVKIFLEWFKRWFKSSKNKIKLKSSSSYPNSIDHRSQQNWYFSKGLLLMSMILLNDNCYLYDYKNQTIKNKDINHLKEQCFIIFYMIRMSAIWYIGCWRSIWRKEIVPSQILLWLV